MSTYQPELLREPVTGPGTKRGQVVYLSHGGGPMPLLGEPSHAAMVRFMHDLADQLTKPSAILVISAHWEAPCASLTVSPTPALLYDYHGFPPAAYEIAYPVTGDPALARRIGAVLTAQRITHRFDATRGLDHGVFVPLALLYPAADIPTVQLSLLDNLDPLAHLQLGRALQTILAENVLVIGSGFSFHNLQAFTWSETASLDPLNDAFQDWLIDTCCGNHDRAAREERLAAWQLAPGARHCHPRAEHLLPLHVCAAMAGDRAVTIFDDTIIGKRAVAFRW